VSRINAAWYLKKSDKTANDDEPKQDEHSAHLFDPRWLKKTMKQPRKNPYGGAHNFLHSNNQNSMDKRRFTNRNPSARAFSQTHPEFHPKRKRPDRGGINPVLKQLASKGKIPGGHAGLSVRNAILQHIRPERKSVASRDKNAMRLSKSQYRALR
jgi:hypothetical protein